MKNLENLKISKVLNHFEEISKIPRGSGNEKEISNYLVNFAKKLGLEVIQDEALNVIIKKSASKGYENAPTVIIQGHLDMVCEKNKDTIHDFLKDPIELIVKEDYIYANGTTLGADDGIAVAYAMALLEDKTIEHPPLEILLTTDEETGMTGAMAVSKENLNGKILINIDTEEEGYLLVSCAGGIRTKSSIKIERENINKEKLYTISVRGLKGGHSGTEINKERGNSNKLIGRFLMDCYKNIELSLVSIEGGSKNNAIPREADAIISVNEQDKDKLFSLTEKWNEIFKKELEGKDEGVKLSISENNEDIKIKFTKETTEKTIKLLYLYPSGVNTMSKNIENLTESSTNLGIVKTTEEYVEFDSAVRSSIMTLRDDIVRKIKEITELIGGDFESNAGYPAWEYKKESKIRDICQKVYKDMTGKEPIVYAIHAGVECGLFEERLGDLDMISFGPDIKDAHTPNENLSISSTENVWYYLLEVLKNIK
ncbi:MAG: aminoacyl-histidine dipeptidase [Clostridium sp.]|nr:aminoacyl-histidine dipeptidase [Clostridium sp.]